MGSCKGRRRRLKSRRLGDACPFVGSTKKDPDKDAVEGTSCPMPPRGPRGRRLVIGGRRLPVFIATCAMGLAYLAFHNPQAAAKATNILAEKAADLTDAARKTEVGQLVEQGLQAGKAKVDAVAEAVMESQSFKDATEYVAVAQDVGGELKRRVYEYWYGPPAEKHKYSDILEEMKAREAKMNEVLELEQKKREKASEIEMTEYKKAQDKEFEEYE